MTKPAKRESKRISKASKKLLLQTWVEFARAKEFRELAHKDGMAAATYLRRIVIHHLDKVKGLESASEPASTI